MSINRITLILLLLASSALFAQTTISVDNKADATVNGRILVPVRVSGSLNNVKSFTLQFSYDNTCVSFNHKNESIRSGIENFIFSDEERLEKLFVSVNNGLISISWTNPSSVGAFFNVGKIFDLDFTYLKSFSEIRIKSAVVKDMLGKRLPVSLTHGSISSSSDAAIKIIYPNGGETLEVVGSPANITWTSINVIEVNLEYSTDNGSVWNTIVVDYAAKKNSYLWTLPQTINSANCKIRIKDVVEPPASDESDAVFTINSVPVVTLISPDGGEELKVGGAKLIKWSSRNINNIKLEYCKNASAQSPTWIVINNSPAASTHSFEWIIPNSISADCKIRISDAGNPAINDLSNAAFKIHNDPISVTVSNTVEAKLLIIGKVISGTFWYWNGSWEDEDAHYSEDGVEYDATDILDVRGTVQVNTGWLTSIKYFEMYFSYDPDVLAVESVVPAAVLDKVNYSYENGIIHIVWSASEPLDISGKIFDVNFRYLKLTDPLQWIDRNWNLLIPPVADPRTPTAVIDPQNFSDIKITKVEVKNSLNNLIDASNWSNGSLAISNQRVIKILSPEPGKVLERNDRTYNILWSSRGVVNVAIDYSTDDGSNWIPIVNLTPSASGTYTWQLPDINSTTCKIRIKSADNQVQYISEPFTVTNVKQLNLLSPNGGEVLKVGALKNITWSCTNLDYVKLEYLTDDDAKWNLIYDNIPAKYYKYTWTIPNVSSTNCNVRISEVGVPSLKDNSASAFTINNSPAKISISNVIGNSTNINVPVTSELITSAAYFNMSIRYNPGEATFVKAAANAILGSGNFTCWKSNGTIHIMWVSKIPVDLSGELFLMQFENIRNTNSAIEFDAPNMVRDITTKVIDIEFINGSVGKRIGFRTQRLEKEIAELEKIIPDYYDLGQNYPNPFNPVTTIKYAVPRESHVLIAIYNMLGERIITLVDETREPGFYNAVWDAYKFPSGIYYYSIVTKEFNETKKMILLK